MRYVGYSRGFHDGGLAIIEEDGTVSYASNSERYTKIKYDPMLAPELELSLIHISEPTRRP